LISEVVFDLGLWVGILEESGLFLWIRGVKGVLMQLPINVRENERISIKTSYFFF